jgi:hypothetical protein
LSIQEAALEAAGCELVRSEKVSGASTSGRAEFRARLGALVRIAISEAAFQGIAATLPLGSVGFEAETDDKGRRLIWTGA